MSNVVLANGDIHEVRTDKYGNTERKSVTYADGSCEHIINEYDKETLRLSKITIDNSEQEEYNISSFAQLGGKFSEAVSLTEGSKLMNGVIWGVSASTVGSTAFFSALFFTFLNWAHDLTVGAFLGK